MDIKKINAYFDKNMAQFYAKMLEEEKKKSSSNASRENKAIKK